MLSPLIRQNYILPGLEGDFWFAAMKHYDMDGRQRIQTAIHKAAEASANRGDRFITNNELIETLQTGNFGLSFSSGENDKLLQLLNSSASTTAYNSPFNSEKLNSFLSKRELSDEQIIAASFLLNLINREYETNEQEPVLQDLENKILKLTNFDFTSAEYKPIKEGIIGSLKEAHEKYSTVRMRSNFASPTSPISSESQPVQPTKNNPLIIKQKNIGECAFLAAFQAISNVQHPKPNFGIDHLRSLIQDKGDFYQVSLFNASGQAEAINVNKQELRAFLTGNFSVKTFKTQVTMIDDKTEERWLTQDEIERLKADKEYTKINVDFSAEAKNKNLEEAICLTINQGLCSSMDILRLAYLKSSIFSIYNKITSQASLEERSKIFDNGNSPALIMRALTGWKTGRTNTKSTSNDIDYAPQEPGLFTEGNKWPWENDFNGWIKQFNDKPQNYAITAYSTKQNIDMPKHLRKLEIVSGHAYSVKFEKDSAILRNPWKDLDTVISIEEFKTVFDYMDYLEVAS